ncbi:hypothetical protein FOL47_001835 [Perkinsus chesapeaki]|uniref:RanBP2-type domain-containing protein n=1 Tax=Perkinsus chesapeaki TaxID=330153 RepID=A0A7J6MH52_PERCH|nr:hypothetical protein FOL47_001835 [Perkinsus chesapeaki]
MRAPETPVSESTAASSSSSFSPSRGTDEVLLRKQTSTMSGDREAPDLHDMWTVTKEYVRMRQYQDIPDTDPTAVLANKLREYMERTIADGFQPDPFFHRKSGKLVLSMLHVRMEDGSDEFFEGINGEVSLPTGSLCSERAAIAHARSVHPRINRGMFMGIAVIDVPTKMNDGHTDNPLWPCGACSEWLKKIQESVPNFRVLAFDSVEMNVIYERFLFMTHTVVDHRFTPADLGRWQCDTCHTINPEMTSNCQNCLMERWDKRVLKPGKRRDYRQVLRSLFEATLCNAKPVTQAEWKLVAGWVPMWWLEAEMAPMGLVEALGEEGPSRRYRLTGKGLRMMNEPNSTYNDSLMESTSSPAASRYSDSQQ